MSCDEFSSNPAGGERQVIRLPFAVYTATPTYAWSSIPEGLSEEDLDYYHEKASAVRPRYGDEGDVYEGVFFQKDLGKAVAFRLQVVSGRGLSNRDADYDAFAFVNGEDAWRIDFDELLKQDEFAVPSRQPATFIEYAGEASMSLESERSETQIKRLYRGEELNDFDFSKIGEMISRYGSICEEFFFYRKHTACGDSSVAKTGRWLANPFPPPADSAPLDSASYTSPQPRVTVASQLRGSRAGGVEQSPPQDLFAGARAQAPLDSAAYTSPQPRVTVASQLRGSRADGVEQRKQVDQIKLRQPSYSHHCSPTDSSQKRELLEALLEGRFFLIKGPFLVIRWRTLLVVLAGVLIILLGICRVLFQFPMNASQADAAGQNQPVEQKTVGADSSSPEATSAASTQEGSEEEKSNQEGSQR
ncbi:MAG: hypothetical protein ACI4QD_00440 [Kiritimatiellia bacterium]